MADGRAFTDYLSSGVAHERLARGLGFKAGGGDEFRAALMASGVKSRTFRRTPLAPVPHAPAGRDLPGAGDMAAVSCAPGFFPRILL